MMDRQRVYSVGRRRNRKASTCLGGLLAIFLVSLLSSRSFANIRPLYTESLQYDTTAIAPPSQGLAGPNAAFSAPTGPSASPTSPTASCSSGNLMVSATAIDEGGSSGISDGAGGAIVMWSDARSGTLDLYAKHILGCGALDPAWPADGVRISGQTQDGILVTDGSGGAFAVYWRGTTNSDIYAQHLLSTGMIDPAWPIDGIDVCTAAGAQTFPHAASDGANGVFVTWNDTRFGALQRRIFVQHVLTTGVDPAWLVNGIRAAPGIEADQLLPEICSDGSGGAIVAWTDRRSAAVTQRDIYAQRITASGTLLWDPAGMPVTTAPGQQILNGGGSATSVGFGYTHNVEPVSNAIVPDGANGCFVVWGDTRTLGSTGNDSYAQHLTSTGAVAAGWDPNGVPVSTDAGDQLAPSVLSDGAGGALVSWWDPRPLVLVQHVSASGVVDGPAGGATLSTTAVNFAMSGVPDGSGGAIYTWNDNDGIGPQDANVYAQHVRLTLPLTVDPAWPVNGVPVSTAPYGQEVWSLLSNGAGGAIIFWDDYRNLNWDVGAQEVLASGTLPTFSVSGYVRANCPSPGTGLMGVTVDAYQTGTGDLIGAGVTDASGAFTIPDLCWGSNYTLTDVTPLDYSSVATDLPANGCTGPVAFALQCRSATGTIQSMGFWKHEVGIATGGNGTGHVSASVLCSYLDLIAVHFNDNEINPVAVYQPPASGQCSDKLQVARVLLDLQGNVAMIARARQQLMSLLLNVAAGTINQMQVISVDGATVSQAITYCDNLIDSPTGNYENAKTIADDINNGIKVPAGMIPLTTVQIAYRPGMQAVSFRVTPNPGSSTREFRFTTGVRGPVSLRVFDTSGRLVSDVVRGDMDAGAHSVRWDGRTASGAMVARGLYFARLQTPRESPTIKVLQLARQQ
ncbi:MAG TPA: FlgD immunoglobulin-like domain containing protein [Candidatus Eisenbacteria bacterium]|nr:FlgD immunoglobulin-like domain containing protein [Candidatus Eisenbacteria bacterium]